jgi:putative chitinase
MPNSISRIDQWIEPLNEAMAEYEINTPLRQAAFLAQIAHESGELRYVREIASGEAYEGRADLGNTKAGDGKRFRGRGLIQVTGRANYEACGKALGLPLLDFPEMLELPTYAAKSAAWFWKSRGLNELADNGSFKEITKKINGGYNGWTDRQKFYERAKAVVG